MWRTHFALGVMSMSIETDAKKMWSLTHPQLLKGFKYRSKWNTTEEGGIGARSLAHNILRGRGAC
jgi:hypothetical protein